VFNSKFPVMPCFPLCYSPVIFLQNAVSRTIAATLQKSPVIIRDNRPIHPHALFEQSLPSCRLTRKPNMAWSIAKIIVGAILMLISVIAFLYIITNWNFEDEDIGRLIAVFIGIGLALILGGFFIAHGVKTYRIFKE
jgi:hypothetical protein